MAFILLITSLPFILAHGTRYPLALMRNAIVMYLMWSLGVGSHCLMERARLVDMIQQAMFSSNCPQSITVMFNGPSLKFPSTAT